jgi:purine catabolism regulator
VNSLEYRIVVAVEPGDPLGLAIAERVAGSVLRPVAVSRPFGDPTGRPAAEAEARATLEAAEPFILAPGGPLRPADLVARADRLPAYRLLARLDDLPGGRRLAEDLLAPLRSGRPADQAERLTTLRSVLAHGSAASAAADLGIHRNTLLYRIRRIEARTGWRLDDPQLRLALAVALRLVQFA